MSFTKTFIVITSLFLSRKLIVKLENYLNKEDNN